MHPDLTQQINNSFQGHQARALRGLAGTHYAILPSNVALTSSSSATLFSLPVNGGIWYHMRLALNLSGDWVNGVDINADVGITTEVELLTGASFALTGTAAVAGATVYSQATGALVIPPSAANETTVRIEADFMVKFYEPGLAGLSGTFIDGISARTILAGSYMSMTPTVPLFDK